MTAASFRHTRNFGKAISIWLGLAIFAVLTPISGFSANASCDRDQKGIQLGRTLFENGQYLLASMHFSMLSVDPCNDQITAEAVFGYAASMARLGESAEVLRSLRNPIASDSRFHRRFQILRSFSDLGGDPLDPQDQLKIDIWKLRNSKVDYAPKIEAIELTPLLKAQVASDLDQMAQQKEKSEWLAGSLSALLPGAGQAYSGAWGGAAISLVLNAIFLATTADFVNHNMNGAATAAGLVFSVTYVGNIINAVKVAHLHNESRAAPWEQKLRSELFPELVP